MIHILIIYLLISLGLSSCVPSQNEKSSQGACGPNSSFDPKTRTCAAFKVKSPPVNTLRSVVMYEGTPKTISLDYTDKDNDLATSCSVTDINPPAPFGLHANSPCECLGGFCSITLESDPYFSGMGQFYYSVTDVDGTSNPTLVGVTVKPIAHPPIVGTAVAVGGNTFRADQSKSFTLYYSTTNNTLANFCQVSSISSYSEPLSPANGYLSGGNSNACKCDTNGVCTATITGQPTKHPPDPVEIPTVTEYFTFQVKAGNLWSTPSVPNYYNITYYNNLPAPLPTAVVLATPGVVPTEGFTNGNYFLLPYYSGNGPNDYAQNCKLGPSSANSLQAVGLCDCNIEPSPNPVGYCLIELRNKLTAYDNNKTANYSFTYQVQQSQESQSWGPESAPIYVTVVPYNQPPVLYNTPDPNNAFTTYENKTLSVAPAAPFWVAAGPTPATDEAREQYIKIKVASSNTALFPNSGISILFGGVVVPASNIIPPVPGANTPAWYRLGDGNGDKAGTPITFQFVPATDQVGTAVATISVQDSGSNPVQSVQNFSFPLYVTPINGPPTVRMRTPYIFYDSYANAPGCDDPRSFNIFENCIGDYGIGLTTNNTGLVPNQIGQVIYDYKAGVNYLYSQVAQTKWSDNMFITECPYSAHACQITSTDNPLYNCIGNGNPALGPFTSAISGSYYFDVAGNQCYLYNSSNHSWSSVSEATPTYFCNNDSGYNGSGNPNSVRGAPTLAEDRKIYLDTSDTSISSQGRCYVASSVIGTPQWISFKTSCNVSTNPACYIYNPGPTPVNCIGPTRPRKTVPPAKDIVPAAVGMYYYDYVQDVCYKSVNTDTTGAHSNWVVFGNDIPDIAGNEGQALTLSNVEFAPGSGNVAPTQQFMIKLSFLTNTASGSSILGPVVGNNQLIYNSATDVGLYCNGRPIAGTPNPTDNSSAIKDITFPLTGTNCPGTTDSRYKNTALYFRPQPGTFGRSEIQLSVSNTYWSDPTPTNKYFSVIVYPLSASFNGWNDMVALGNKSTLAGTPAVLENGFVRLGWNPFTINNLQNDTSDPASDPANTNYSSGSIIGYNVYRRTANNPLAPATPNIGENSRYDFSHPLNSTPISIDSLSFVDALNFTSMPPGPPFTSTIYYYTVAAIDSIHGLLLPGFAGSNLNEIKVVVPPDNMALVSRDMVNLEVCQKMHQSPVAGNHNTCSYYGPGDTVTSTSAHIYDIGSDLLVDRFEAGCPIGHYDTALNPKYVNASCIGSANNVCYGSTVDLVWATAPAGPAAGIGAQNDIFYSRVSGQCVYNPKIALGASGSWKDFSEIVGTPNYSANSQFANLPPLVNITQDKANQVCKSRPTFNLWSNDTYNYFNLNPTPLGNAKLPSRKQQIAYSAWSNSYKDSEITDLETGWGLNAAPKCNSAYGNGLEEYFTDADVVPASIYYTLPGTSSLKGGPNSDQLIRSFITGSNITANASAGGLSGCISRYGIQDVVGNVKEWVEDRIFCYTANECTGVYKGYNGKPVRFNISDEITFAIGLQACLATGRTDNNCIINAATNTLTTLKYPGILSYQISSNPLNSSTYFSVSTAPDTWTPVASGCPVSYSSIETGCSVLYTPTTDINNPGNPGLNCVGAGTPIGIVTPTHAESYYLDTKTGKCWKSNLTNLATPWTDLSTDPYFPTLYSTLPTPLNNATDFLVTGDSYFYGWALDGRTGPNNSGNGLIPIRGWQLKQKSNDASRFIFPLGIPSTGFFASNFANSSSDVSGASGSKVVPYLLSIGGSAGITTNALHNNYFSINSDVIFYSSLDNRCGAMTSGGSYTSNNGAAGRYTGEFYPCNTFYTPANTPVVVTPNSNIAPDVGFRCLVPLP